MTTDLQSRLETLEQQTAAARDRLDQIRRRLAECENPDCDFAAGMKYLQSLEEGQSSTE